jgi:hypothetical protein
VDDTIIEMWQKRESAAQLMRDAYEPEWIKNWKSYRAFIEESPDPQDWWRSSVFIPELFNAVETILPRSILGMYAKPEWFDVNCLHSGFEGHNAQGMDCQKYEMAIKSLLMNGSKRMNLFEPSYLGAKYGTILGHTWYKLRWERTIDNRMVDTPVTDPETGEVLGMSADLQPTISYDDPKLDWISNFRLWADPTGKNDWFIEELETTVEKLETLNRQFGGSLYKNLRDVGLMAAGISPQPVRPVDRNQGMGGTFNQREESIAATEGLSQTYFSEGFDGPTVVLKICSGRVNYEPNDGVRWRRQIIVNDRVVIRDVPSPTPDLKPEYFGVPQIPIPGFVYGDSVLRYAGPLNDQLNRIENFRMDEVVLGIWQQYIANRSAVTDTQLLQQPGGVVWVDTAADVQTAFRVLDRKPLLPQAYNESAVKRDQMERITGATALQQGSQGADRETATSVGARTALGGERFRLATMWQNFKFKRELLKRMFAMYQRNLPPGRLVRLIGSDEQLAMDISMLKDDVDVSIDAEMTQGDNAAKQQALAFFMQTAASPVFAQWWKLENLLPDVAAAYVEKDSRKYVRTPEEMAALQQAQMFTNALGMDATDPSQPGGNAAAGGGASQGLLGSGSAR